MSVAARCPDHFNNFSILCKAPGAVYTIWLQGNKIWIAEYVCILCCWLQMVINFHNNL